MSKEEEVVFDLPEDVLVKILCRLPVKSLIRFTCVSKRWCSVIISDSQFARSTFEVASQTRTLRPRLLLCTYPYTRGYCPRFEWEPSRFECLGFRRLGHALFLGKFTGSPSQICMGTCIGLGNVYRSYTNLSAWNPSTGFFRKIPSPEFLLEKGRCISSATCGFGHVMATDYYKLVFFEPLDLAVHIFSTKDSSWKVFRAIHLSFPHYYGRALLVSNGAIHWVSGVRKFMDLSHVY